MKDKSFIYYGNPCITPMADPDIQKMRDARDLRVAPCRLYPGRQGCSGPDYACIKLAGAAMARYVIMFYSEATEATLAAEREEFARLAPLPPDGVRAYVEVNNGLLEQFTDPGEITERVWKYARAVLDLKPGERIFRSPEESWAPPETPMPAAPPARARAERPEPVAVA